MSNTPINSGSSWAGNERRRQTRTRPGALVYLDLGAANGGIITDLTEGGAGVQAVSPLDALTTVPIRFQIPDSQTRIKAAAEIMWVSESRRHGGLRFLDLAEETRAQIRGWLGSPAAPSKEPVQKTNAQKTPSYEEVFLNPRKDKWSSLLANRQAGGQQVEPPWVIDRPASTLSDDSPKRETTGQPDPSTAIPVHGFLREIALAKKTRPLRQDSPPDVTTALEPGGNQTLGSAATEPSGRTSHREGLIRWPVTASPAQRSGENEERAATESAAPMVPAKRPPILDSATSFGRSAEAPAPTTPANDRLVRFWKWAGLAIFGAVLCLGSFRVGKWLSGGGAVHQTPEEPPVVIQKSAAETVPQPRKSAVLRAATPPVVHRNRVEAVTHKPAQGNSEVIPLSAASVRPAVQQPMQQAARPMQSLQPAQPPRQRTPLAVVRPPQKPPEAVGANDTTQPLPTAVVVNGRVLEPTDRFNPAHLTYRFDPTYPADAREQNVEGTVTLHLAIDSSGTVQSVKPLDGPAILIPAAVAAAKNWRFLPALLNGQPVETEQDVKIDFRLPRSPDR
jgi:periplasmic protein TonB